jgi:hypothetical protein
MGRWQYFPILLLTMVMLFGACPAYCTNYYVATNGSDDNNGLSIDYPFKTIGKAVSSVAAGGTIYVRGGTYTYTGSSTAITLPSKSGSSPTNRCSLMGYNGERPLVDFSAMTGTSADGLKINGSYWYVKGIDFKGAPHNGIKISGGSYNIVEFCSSYENRNTGIQLGGGAANNQIINCDSYYNRDAGDGNADGFSPKLDVGTGNYFYGCRSWQNSDDGYDGYLRPSDDVTTTYENCWCFKNGYLKSGAASVGNGNGFKMGGSDNKDLRHNAILKNCLSFSNRVKGFDQNNNKGSMTLYNCTAFSNGTNYSIPSALASGKTATLTNCVNFTGSNNLGSFVVQTTDSWQSPFVVTSADFVSIDPAAAYGARNADGSLPNITFMHLAAGSDLIDGGTDVGLPYNGSAPDLGCFETGGGGLPGQAGNPTPTNGATNVSLTQDISWTAGSGATSRDVYFGTVNPPVTKVIADGTALTYDTGTMATSTTYYWRIDEKNTGGTTTGTVWSFTTVPPAPGAATSPNPANSATDVSLTQDINWTAGSGATSRDVYFGAVNPPVTKVIADGTALTYDTGTMATSTTYYWRVDEKNAGGTTTGTVWSFTTVPPAPGQAGNPTPTNGATNVSLIQDISWTAGSGATSHDVYFGTANPPPFIVNQADTTYDIGTMDAITTYYWRIDEKNAGGTTTGSVWSFTTLDATPPAPNPMTWAIEPNAISSSSIGMTATTATDISGVEYYFANITDPNHDSNWVASPSWTDTGLDSNTTYTYQVRARDLSANHNETGWSGTANATTLAWVCDNPIASDIDGDCQVDFFDFASLADAWAGNLPPVDLNGDSVLDFKDIAQFANDWLTCNRNPAEECWQ